MTPLVPGLLLNMLCYLYTCRSNQFSVTFATVQTRVGIIPVKILTVPKIGISRTMLKPAIKTNPLIQVILKFKYVKTISDTV